MLVRYTFPVRGKLQLQEKGNIRNGNWHFKFQTNSETGYVDRLVVEVSGIDRERWPTISPIRQAPNTKQPHFPFAVNSNAFSFSEFESEIINLESYLSLFGLEEIVLGMMQEEWIKEKGDELLGMMTGYTIGNSETGAHLEKPRDQTLHICVVAAAHANTSKTETAALAHFRVGQANMFNHRYIEAIRHLYLFIECLFSNGKHQQRATVEEFSKSPLLMETIEQLFFDKIKPHTSFNLIRMNYPTLRGEICPTNVLTFLFQLRGSLQHANPKKAEEWHPSKQNDFMHEAICIMNICEDIAFSLFENREKAITNKDIPFSETQKS